MIIIAYKTEELLGEYFEFPKSMNLIFAES